MSQYKALKAVGYADSTATAFPMPWKNCPSLRRAIEEEFEERRKLLAPIKLVKLRAAPAYRLDNLVKKRKRTDGGFTDCPRCGRREFEARMFLDPAGTGYICQRCATTGATY
jgi:hypothetical protein